MALDEALTESVRSGGPPVLRFYRWSPPCLSLGRNQPAAGEYDAEVIARLGLDVVRRPTGGRAVLHHRELTYSVVVPDGALGSPREAYAAINRGLVIGLRRLGVAAELQGAVGRRAPVLSLAACFREPAEGEVVVRGRKLVGSAQYREGGVTLQHGSLLLADDQSTLGSLRLRPAPAEDPPATLTDYLHPLPPWEELAAALAAGVAEVIRLASLPSDPSPAELARADAIRARYADPDWTWRR